MWCEQNKTPEHSFKLQKHWASWAETWFSMSPIGPCWVCESVFSWGLLVSFVSPCVFVSLCHCVFESLSLCAHSAAESCRIVQKIPCRGPRDRGCTLLRAYSAPPKVPKPCDFEWDPPSLGGGVYRTSDIDWMSECSYSRSRYLFITCSPMNSLLQLHSREWTKH